MDTNAAREIQSVRRDILYVNNERDFQAMGLFLLPPAWKYMESEVAVIGIQFGGAVRFHYYPECSTPNSSKIFAVARNGHMMWRKHTAATSETAWRDWRIYGPEKGGWKRITRS